MVCEPNEKEKRERLEISQPPDYTDEPMSLSPPPGHSPDAPRRTIGWFTAACVLVSNIIGGGIFTTTGFLARDIGDPLLMLALWFLGALVALAGATAYAELGAAYPQAGGDYLYLREAYGALPAFLSGWTSFTIGFGAAIAASSVGFASYLSRVLPLEEQQSIFETGLALGLVWCLTAVHAAGVGAGGLLQRLLTTAKLAALGVLIVGGFLFGSGAWEHLAVRSIPAGASLGSAAVAFIFVMYCYLGWNVVGYIAGEIAEPTRTLPRIMIGGTAFVAAIYLSLNVLYLYALPMAQLAEPPILPVAEKAAAALWGPAAARWIALLLALSLAGGVSAMMWAGPRVCWAMAKDGVLSPWLAGLHESSAVPVRAMLIQALWASVLIVTGTFEQLVIYSGVVLAAFVLLVLGAVIRLRRHKPGLPRPYLVPFYPWLPGILMIGAGGLVGSSILQHPMESLLGLATVLAGLPFYRIWSKLRHARPMPS